MPDIWIDVDTAVAIPVNKYPLTDDTDFVSREVAIAYNEAGMDLVWNFVTSAGVMTQTAVTPTTAGVYDWTHVGDGMYKIEIPASAGGSINNDTEGYGWFTGVCTGVLPWASPIYGFRAAGLNDLLTDSAYSTTRGLAGTALPAAAAEASGGLYTRGTGAGQINQTTNGHVDIDAHYWNGTEITTSLETAADIADAVFDEALSGHVTAGTAGERIGRIPNAAAGGNGGLPTVDANNRIVGIQGTLNTLDALDTAQDTQHAATLTRLGTPAGADIAADLATIVADTNELQTDWANAGRLDTILDARAAQTTVDAIETDTQDIQSRLPAALVGGRMDSDVEAINNNTAAADNLQASALGLVSTTVNDASASITGFVTALTETTDDHYNGRVIVFTSGDLAGQATDITDYDGTTKAVTVTALTEAPANGVSFVIV